MKKFKTVKKLKPKKKVRTYVDAWTSSWTGDVHLAWRDEKGKKHIETIEAYAMCDWYFYITAEDFAKIDPEVITAFKRRDTDIFDAEIRFEAEGKNWVKVFVENKGINEKYSDKKDDRVRLKQLFQEDGIRLYEGDLKPHKRYCIDNDITVSNDFRLLYYDIETDDSNPGLVVGRDRVLSIAGFDQDGKVYFWSNADEKTLLEEFFEDIKYNFDILLGWNSDNFDDQVLIKRMDKNFMEDELRYFKWRIAHIDLMQIFIKRFSNDTKITSWALDFISKYFLGYGKVEIEKGTIFKLYNEDFAKFKEYNIKDAKLLYDLNLKLGIVDQLLLECQITGAFPSKYSVSELLDTYILRSVKGQDIHFPSIEYDEKIVKCPKCHQGNRLEEGHDESAGNIICTRCGKSFDPAETRTDIIGAYVVDPVSGLHDNVFTFDYKCWLPGTRIYTDKGFREIQNLGSGDRVQVRGEQFDNVVQIVEKPHCGEIIKLTLDSGLELKVTPEHRFLLEDGDSLAQDLKMGDYLLEPNGYCGIGDSDDEELFELVGIFDCDGYFNSKFEPKYNHTQTRVQFTTKNHEYEFFDRGCYLIDSYFAIPFEAEQKSMKPNLKESLIYKPKLIQGNQSKLGSQQLAYKQIVAMMSNLKRLTFSTSAMIGYLRGCFNSDASINVSRGEVTINSMREDRIRRIHTVSLLLGLKPRYCRVERVDGLIEYRVIYRETDALNFIFGEIGLIETVKSENLKEIIDNYRHDTIKKIRRGQSRIVKIEKIDYDGPVYSLAVENQNNPYYVAEGIISHNSLYPSIIITWNIGPDSIIEEEDLILLEQHDRIWDEAIKSANDQYFWKDRPSAIRKAIEKLLSLRAIFKKEMIAAKVDSREYDIANAKQRATKLLCNSMYGIMGYPRGRFYRREIAEAITLGGQWLNKKTKVWFEEKGYEVIYGDTDSVFVKMPEEDRELIPGLLKELHDFYDEVLKTEFNIDTHRIELEYEKHFKRLLLLKKKHYAGHIIEQDGAKVDKTLVKGLEYIKRDTIPIAKRWQKELLDLILFENHDQAFYVNWVEEKLAKYFSADIDISELVITKKLTKKPASYKVRAVHVSVAEEMKKRKMEFYIGMRVPYIIISEKPLEAVHPEWYEEGMASHTYYWDKQIYSILERILEVVYPDYDWSQYTTKIKTKRQKKIEMYLKWIEDPKKQTEKRLQGTEKKIRECKLISEIQREELLKYFRPKRKKFKIKK